MKDGKCEGDFFKQICSETIFDLEHDEGFQKFLQAREERRRKRLELVEQVARDDKLRYNRIEVVSEEL